MRFVSTFHQRGSGDGEFTHGDFGDARSGFGSVVVFQVEFHRFLEHLQGFFPCFAKAGNVKIEALGDVV